jgi:hypothetical protein
MACWRRYRRFLITLRLGRELDTQPNDVFPASFRLIGRHALALRRIPRLEHRVFDQSYVLLAGLAIIIVATVLLYARSARRPNAGAAAPLRFNGHYRHHFHHFELLPVIRACRLGAPESPSTRQCGSD